MVKKPAMNNSNTALFIGHDDCYGVSRSEVEKAIISLTQKGVTDFLSGGQGGFDRLCAGCVFRLKKDFPQIRNLLVIPYLTFNIFDKEIFDEIIYPEGFEKYHFKSAILARNKYMVNCSNYAICYVNHDWGGAARTYDYAIKRKLNITHII